MNTESNLFTLIFDHLGEFNQARFEPVLEYHNPNGVFMITHIATDADDFRLYEGDKPIPAWKYANQRFTPEFYQLILERLRND